MRNLKISLSLVAILSLYSSANAQSLTEVLTNGKVSGELTTTYENRDFDGIESMYYQNTGYAVGSFALKYETGNWNGLSLTSKFRAYATIFEDDDNSTTYHGTGDSSERFYEDGSNKNVDIEELFLAYNPNDSFSIKAGRQFISSLWVNKTQDAIKVDASYGDTSLEAIWSLRQGRVYSRDYRPVSDINDDKGIYQFALTHKFNDNFSITAYDAINPDNLNILGGKIDSTFDLVSFGAHYAKSNDKNDSSKDSNLIHLTASTEIAGFTPYIGFIKVDEDAEFPGWAGIAGETIVPMEEGDYIYSKDAKTLYLGVSKSFGDLSTSLLYGQTQYLSGTDKQTVNETTLWLGYPIAKDLKANLGYTLVNEDENSGVSDLNQINLTLTYSF